MNSGGMTELMSAQKRVHAFTRIFPVHSSNEGSSINLQHRVTNFEVGNVTLESKR